MPSGYSGKRLVEKLGIGRGDAIAFVNAPDGYYRALGKLPDEVKIVSRPTKELDFLQLFVTGRKSLERDLAGLKAALKQDGMIWVSWPKRSSRIETDLTENVVRDVGLENGLVDVKVCAVDETWSALKLVKRLKDRSAPVRV